MILSSTTRHRFSGARKISFVVWAPFSGELVGTQSLNYKKSTAFQQTGNTQQRNTWATGKARMRRGKRLNKDHKGCTRTRQANRSSNTGNCERVPHGTPPHTNMWEKSHPHLSPIRRPAGVSASKVLFLFLFLVCTCSFVLLLRAFASSELSPPPLPPSHLAPVVPHKAVAEVSKIGNL